MTLLQDPGTSTYHERARLAKEFLDHLKSIKVLNGVALIDADSLFHLKHMAAAEYKRLESMAEEEWAVREFDG